MTTASIHSPVPVSVGESQELADRLASSVALRRAARLRTFLLYVCDQTLHHGVGVIHEQEIGVAVFGRSPGYDTGIDNIVRVNATELRKRLELYFADEGSHEQIILEIQRGSYAPVFRRRLPATAALDVPPSHEKTLEPPPSSFAQAAEPLPLHKIEAPFPSSQPKSEEPPAVSANRARRMLAWQLASALLLLLCGYLGWQLHELTLAADPWRRQPALHSFWRGFFESGTATNILLADTSFAIAQDLMQRPISLTDYVDYKYKRFAEDPALSETQRHDLMLVLERNMGSNADFRVGQQILSLNGSDPSHLTLKFAREYTPDAAKRNSLVLIGSRQSNPWVSLFSSKLNFDLIYDVAHGRPLIVNRNPRSGEPSSYPAADGADGLGTGYAVIAFLPGMSEHARILMIEGTDSQATGAAGDYVTNEESMQALEERFQPGKIPFFEVVMRTSQLNGTPLHGEVIALRTYDASP